jgi:hypothetical protein
MAETTAETMAEERCPCLQDEEETAETMAEERCPCIV